MPATLLLTALLAAAQPAPGLDSCSPGVQGLPVPIDVRGQRFFARWRLRQGGELRFYLDTGGGLNMLFPETVSRLGLVPYDESMGEGSMTLVRLPRDLGTGGFPDIAHAIPRADSVNIHLFVPPATGEGGQLLRGFANDSLRVDGFLGRQWFADRVWLFDYPGRRLAYFERAPEALLPARCWVPLAFQVDSAGQRTSHFPRISAVVDGDSLHFLFDTGAMTLLTDSAWRLADLLEPRYRATSFITRETFDRWRARHPDWLVIMNAEQGTGAAMIRVPEIEIGGSRLGPVWFTGRPTGTFHGYFSQMMDRRIDGALGGSAFRYAAVVADYPRSRAAVLVRPAP